MTYRLSQLGHDVQNWSVTVVHAVNVSTTRRRVELCRYKRALMRIRPEWLLYDAERDLLATYISCLFSNVIHFPTFIRHWLCLLVLLDVSFHFQHQMVKMSFIQASIALRCQRKRLLHVTILLTSTLIKPISSTVQCNIPHRNAAQVFLAEQYHVTFGYLHRNFVSSLSSVRCLCLCTAHRNTLPSSIWHIRHLQASSENAPFCHVIPLIFPNCAHRILFCILTLKSVLEVIFRVLNDTVIIFV